MANLISKKALLEELKKHESEWHKDKIDTYAVGLGLRIAIDLVKNMPTVDRWIPCSERLPEEYKGVLVDIGGIYEIAWRNGETWHHKDGWFSDSKVVAWMPLPEPYKAGDIDG